MNKKSMFSAAVLLAMGTTAGATNTQGPAEDIGLNIPLPGTTEYITASRSVDDIYIVQDFKKKKPPKK